MINNRLSNISSNQEVFDLNKQPYQAALNTSGHKYKLEYKQNQQKNKRKHTRKVIWYNPPWNSSVKFDLGKQFLKLIDKYFPHNHRLHKIINRNTIKIGYSCTPNVKTIITSHNKKVMSNNLPIQPTKQCNCINKST